MSNEQSEWRYVPPTAPRHDFDDSLVHCSNRAAATRWLAGFDSRVGEPVENVQLARRCPSGAQVAVGTFQPLAHEDSTTHRFNAAWMLDSRQFYRPGPPATRTLMMGVDHCRQISQDDSQ